MNEKSELDCPNCGYISSNINDEIDRLRDALAQIESMEPATQEMTLAHQMAQIARVALSDEERP